MELNTRTRIAWFALFAHGGSQCNEIPVNVPVVTSKGFAMPGKARKLTKVN